MAKSQVNITRVARGKIDKDIDKEIDNLTKQMEKGFNDKLNTQYVEIAGDEMTGPLILPRIILKDTDLLRTPKKGAIEYYDGRFHITNDEVRRGLDSTSDVIIADTVVTNTVVETTVWTGTLAANTLKVRDIMKVFISGVITNASAADDITFRKYIGSNMVEEFTPAIGNVTGAGWTFENTISVRTIGAGGTLAFHGVADINANIEHVHSLENIDTTVAENVTMTVEWANAKAGNSITVQIGFMEFKHGT